MPEMIRPRFSDHLNKQRLSGSGLARDSITAMSLADRVARIAGKPAPTGLVLNTHAGVSVGAGLLAIASLRCTWQTT